MFTSQLELPPLATPFYYLRTQIVERCRRVLVMASGAKASLHPTEGNRQWDFSANWVAAFAGASA
jgi:hypothetical protein